MATKGRTHLLDRALAALAERQHGVLSWKQLAALGMSADERHTRIAAGRLHRLHRGVYGVVGYKLLRTEGRWLAAVFAVGEGAVLSHRSAGSLWGLLPSTGQAPEVAVARKVKQRSGIQLHCLRSLPAGHITTRSGIPCTTVARTIVDLAAVLPARRLEQVIGQAEVLRLFDRTQTEAILAANPHAPGSRTLRGLLGLDFTTSLTRSELEEQFVALCDDARVDRPELNVPYTLPDGTEIVIDALWRSARLAVELDGRAYHSSWSAQVRDRRRDAQLTLAGLKPLRLTAPDVIGAKRNATIALLGELVRRAA